jgi:two-component system, chemotaxis family, protein-glutamate methylesterase/glutaminase
LIVRVLIAEDDSTSALLLEKSLQSDGYEVTVTNNGLQALEALRVGEYDALLTDWMMPELDGIALVRRLRAEFDNPPPILVVTALSSEDARRHALEAGADDYLAKPYVPHQLLQRVRDCIQRAQQPVPVATDAPKAAVAAANIGCVGVGLAASTGGPEALRAVLSQLPDDSLAAYFVVLHGPGWMLQTFVDRVAEEVSLGVCMAGHGMEVKPRNVYVCPGDNHMEIEVSGKTLRLTSEPPENFVRPAADPLFRSLAAVFGANSVAVILTGMGRDASLGAQAVRAAGGRVIVQDPTLAVAASMPRTVISLGLADEILALGDIAAQVTAEVERLAGQLA